jgi:hypothetical protein
MYERTHATAPLKPFPAPLDVSFPSFFILCQVRDVRLQCFTSSIAFRRFSLHEKKNTSL